MGHSGMFQNALGCSKMHDDKISDLCIERNVQVECLLAMGRGHGYS